MFMGLYETHTFTTRLVIRFMSRYPFRNFCQFHGPFQRLNDRFYKFCYRQDGLVGKQLAVSELLTATRLTAWNSLPDDNPVEVLA